MKPYKPNQLQGIIFTISLVRFPLLPFLVLSVKIVTASSEVALTLCDLMAVFGRSELSTSITSPCSCADFNGDGEVAPSSPLELIVALCDFDVRSAAGRLRGVVGVS